MYGQPSLQYYYTFGTNSWLITFVKGLRTIFMENETK